MAHVVFRGSNLIEESITFINHKKESNNMNVNIKTLIDDVQCYDTVRELRWPEGRECPFCNSKKVIKRGYDHSAS